MLKKTLVLIAVAGLCSCSESLVYSDYRATSNSAWAKEDLMEFQFENNDTVSKHHLYISVRNDATFPYSNLFLIASMEFPSGMAIRDTLEYTMAAPDGSWLGQGAGSLIENRFWYKENIVFPATGVYTLRIEHAMRENGSVDGVNELPGITDVGVEIEKAE